MTEPAKYVAQYLERPEGAPDPLDAKAHQERAAFLREDPDLQSAGFNLRTGMLSQTFPVIAFGRWEQPEGLDDDTDLAVLRNLHERAVSEWREMAQTLVTIYADPDPSLNEAGRLKIAARVIKPRLDQLAEVAAEQLAKVDQAVQAEEAAIAAALRPTDPAAAALHADIRAHWKAAKTGGERNQLILGILQGSIDDDTLAALATAPAYLSGMTADLHAKARALLAQRRAPDRVRRVEALRLGKARALQALSALDSTANRLIDFRKAAALAEKERRYA
jgi:hypothetical protein